MSLFICIQNHMYDAEKEKLIMQVENQLLIQMGM